MPYSLLELTPLRYTDNPYFGMGWPIMGATGYMVGFQMPGRVRDVDDWPLHLAYNDWGHIYTVNQLINDQPHSEGFAYGEYIDSGTVYYDEDGDPAPEAPHSMPRFDKSGEGTPNSNMLWPGVEQGESLDFTQVHEFGDDNGTIRLYTPPDGYLFFPNILGTIGYVKYAHMWAVYNKTKQHWAAILPVFPYSVGGGITSNDVDNQLWVFGRDGSLNQIDSGVDGWVPSDIWFNPYYVEYKGYCLDTTPDGATWYGKVNTIHRHLDGSSTTYSVERAPGAGIVALPNNNVLFRGTDNLVYELAIDGSVQRNESVGAESIVAHDQHWMVTHDNNYNVWYGGTMLVFGAYGVVGETSGLNYWSESPGMYQIVGAGQLDTIIPPLRMLQRDDPFNTPRAVAGQNQPTSIQYSIRRGWMNTYL